MYIVESPSINPYINLAMEEYLFNNLEKGTSCFMLWQNDNTIVIGNYQNAAEEVNLSIVEQQEIRVVRRLSGGGAVYHDLGNLNYTFITDEADIETIAFERFVQPLIRTLAVLGVKAEFTGRNDVEIKGMKICGNAQRISRKRVLHHGCILLDSNPDLIARTLNPKRAKIESRSTKSVKSRTTSINEHLHRPISVRDFKRRLVAEVAKEETLIPYEFPPEAAGEIVRLCSEKYATWEWNYGNAPQYEMTREKKFPGGLVSVNMNVVHGKIDKIRFYGDFFANRDPEELEAALEGVRLDADFLQELEARHAGEYFSGITAENLRELILMTGV